MAIRTEPPAVVTGQTMTATNWNTWFVNNMIAMWPYLAAGDIAYASAANQLTRLGIGATGSMLRSTGSAPTWFAKGGTGAILRSTASTVGWLELGAAGGLLKSDGTNPGWLTLGAAGQSLKSTGTLPAWEGMRGARVSRSSGQSIPAAVLTTVTWNAEDFDSSEFFSAGAPTVFTAPRTGYYLCGANVLFQNTGQTEARILYITPSVGNHPVHVTVNSRNGGTTGMNASGFFYLQLGETVSVTVWQSSAGYLDLLADSFFWIVDMGP